ncbi:MAG: hypothetical protein OXI91_14090 [Chloroflexota bacterium]|nr:hypothetical protein [Chloroflexota bacterium]
MKEQMRKEAKGIGEIVKRLLSVLVGVFAGFALLLWVWMFLSNPEDPLLGGTPTALAAAIAIVGVFGWTGGMSSKVSSDLRANLRRIGILHTVAALFLVIMGLLLPIIAIIDTDTNEYWWIAGFFVAFTFLATLAFGFGTYKFVSILLDLWKIKDKGADERDGMPP